MKLKTIRVFARHIFSCTLVLTVLGCAEETPEVCLVYVECEKHAAQVLGRDEFSTFAYGTNGVCWENEEIAALCRDECVGSLETLIDDLNEANQELGPCDMPSIEAPNDDTSIEEGG